MISFDKHIVGPWVFSRIGKTWGPEGREAIGVIEDGEVKAGLVFEDYSGRSIVSHIAISSPHTPIRELLAVCAGYAYNQLKVHKVLAPVSSDNRRSINFVMKLGFEPEAIIKDAMPNGDLLVFSMSRSRCGFIPNVKEAA
jgi:hypothetical protein